MALAPFVRCRELVHGNKRAPLMMFHFANSETDEVEAAVKAFFAISVDWETSPENK